MGELFGKSFIRKTIDIIYENENVHLADFTNLMLENPDVFKEAMAESYKDALDSCLGSDRIDAEQNINALLGSAIVPLLIAYRNNVDALVDALCGLTKEVVDNDKLS